MHGADELGKADVCQFSERLKRLGKRSYDPTSCSATAGLLDYKQSARRIHG
jgi:hypothetical protein